MNFMSSSSGTGGEDGFYEEAGSSNNQAEAAPVPFSLSHSHQKGGLVVPYYAAYNSGGGGGGGGGDSPLSNSNNEDSDDHMHSAAAGATSSSAGMVIEREHMFDKVVTPSDVGKLNRLVIPKQHAEKYFPLDSSTNEKGLLLNFEDRNGKPWRFRYSYWNSSQSYVMTKGWSRFVKEKKLDAGDIVSFQRGAGQLGKDRLFIDWRRRPDHGEHHHHLISPPNFSNPHQFSLLHRSTWNNHPLFFQPPPSNSHLSFPPPHAGITYSHHHHLLQHQPSHNNSSSSSSSNIYGLNSGSAVVNGNPFTTAAGSIIYLKSAGGGGSSIAPQHVQAQRGVSISGVEAMPMPMPMVFDSVPVVQGKAAAKRLRLFGVNMECPINSESDEYDILSSSTTTLSSQPQYYYSTTTTTMPPAPLPLPHHHLNYSSSSNSSSYLQLRPNHYDEQDIDEKAASKSSKSLDFNI